MKWIKNKKLRNGLIILLLIVNVSALSSFIIAKISSSKSTAMNDPDCEVERILVQQIGFDDDQIAQYNILKADYDRDVTNIRMNMHGHMTAMLAELAKNDPDTAFINHRAELFGRYEADLKIRTMKHLIHLRQMSKSGQEERFEELFGQLHYRHRRGWGRGQGMGRGRGMGYGRQNIPYWQNQQIEKDTAYGPDSKTF